MRAMNALHFLLIAAIMLGGCYFAYAPSMRAGEYFNTVGMAIGIFYLVVTAFLYRVYNVYSVGLYRVGEIIYAHGLANLLSAVLTYLCACFVLLRALAPLPMLLILVVQMCVSTLWCLSANRLYFKLHRPKKTLVIYREDTDLEQLKEIAFFSNRFDIQGTLKAPQSKEIRKVFAEMAGYEVVFVSGVEATMRNGIVKECIEKGMDCYFVPHTGDVIIAGAKHIQSFSVPIMRVRRAAPKPEYALIKRLMDVVCALLALTLTSPLMLCVAVCIKVSDGGPVLYKQVRLTKDARQFKILKFRSMRVDAEKDGIPRVATEHDEHITKVGRVIRKVRIDELPQMINILKGDMSLVGPRPERPELVAQYERQLPAFGLRLQVKAGLTGMAQVYGRYNTRPQDKLKMDLMYINKMSLAQDARLLFATVRVLFMRESTEGVAEGQMTAVKDVGKSA